MESACQMKTYKFSTGETFIANNYLELREILELNEEHLQNYTRLSECVDDGDHVAQAGSLCGSKYSKSFIIKQTEKYSNRVNELKIFAKQALRSDIKTLKKQYTKEQLEIKSKILLQILEEDSDFKNSENIMLYSALPDEVQTSAFIEKWRSKKHIILPGVSGNDIIPVALDADTVLVEGKFHILEPQNKAYEGTFDLIIVPGVAFDKEGNRLGRGRGYYDRFLSKHLNVKRIGLCFDFQLVKNIPTDANDIKMDKIICVPYR